MWPWEKCQIGPNSDTVESAGTVNHLSVVDASVLVCVSQRSHRFHRNVYFIKLGEQLGALLLSNT